MNRNKDNNSNTQPSQPGTGGTGSAEQTGRNRDEQKNKMTDLDKGARKDVASDAGIGRKRITTLKDMGSLSGRDDYAGGSGDDMSSENTNERTDR